MQSTCLLGTVIQGARTHGFEPGFTEELADYSMKLKDSISTIILVFWTLGWLSFVIRQLWLGSVTFRNGPRDSGGTATYTFAEAPWGFCILLAIQIALVLLGVFLTFATVRSSLRDNRM